MKRFPVITVSAVMVLMMVSGITFSQRQAYRFDRLTTKEGLSSNRVWTLFEDSRKLLWIGTDRGLNCYNGTSVIRFDRPKDPEIISRVFVSSLMEDRNGIIWIGTFNHGVFTYDPVRDVFRRFYSDSSDSKSLKGNYVNALYTDKNGTVWVGTNEGLNRFDQAAGSFALFLPDPDRPESGKNFVISLIEDNRGVFWIGTGEGIFHFDRSKELFQPFHKSLEIPEDYRKILCFLESRDGILWFGTYKGFFKYLSDGDQLLHIRGVVDGSDHLLDDAITSIRESNLPGRNELWLATRNGLIRFNPADGRFQRIGISPGEPAGLSNSCINDLWLNGQGILWIGAGWSGINKLDIRDNPFHQVVVKSLRDGSPLSVVSFLQDRSGYLWVGTNWGGMIKYDQHMNPLAQFEDTKGSIVELSDGPVFNSVESIVEGNDNILWVGLAGWGPALFDRNKEIYFYLEVQPPAGKPRPTRGSDIHMDRTGMVWFATTGLYKKEPSDGKYDPFKPVDNEMLQQCEVYDIFESANGDLWFGTQGKGMFCLRSGERSPMNFRRYGSSESESGGLFNTTVLQTTQDIDGIIWAVSRRGLNRYNSDNDRFELISDTTGLFARGLFAVFGDRRENLWLSQYPKGLIRYSPATNKVKIFDTKDGLPFDNLVPRYWYQSPDGRIFIVGWLGTADGFFFFHPDSVPENQVIPQVLITGFQIGDQPYHPDSNISFKRHLTLNHNQNFFSVAFSVPDYINPEKNQYAYFLEGLENGWIHCGNRRIAYYTKVPPGHYTFHVKGANNDGYWNEAGANLAITILPPPWKTWWAYVLYGIFIAGICFLAVRFYLNRLRLAHRLEMEQLDSQKLKELDKMKSRFFANISHEFRTPLTLILGPMEKIRGRVSDEVKRDLDMMQRNACRLQELISQLLDISRLESGKMRLEARETDLVRLLNGYVQSFESYAKQRNIELVFNADATSLMVWIDPDKIEKIIFNLLSNAFKFTPEGGRIMVGVGSWQLAVDRNKTEDRRPKTAVPQSQYKNTMAPRHHGTMDQFTRITVRDTGTGISSDKLSRIFDRFYQADDSDSRTHEGTGIGLALTKELVELHHATITMDSEVGKGTTFTVTLPLGKEHLKEEELAQGTGNRVQKSEVKDLISDIPHLTSLPTYNSQAGYPQREESKSPLGDSGVEKPLLLVVEDNADLREYIRGILGESYRMVEAGDGEEGLKVAIETVPDLILSDVMMPKIDGYQLCHTLKTDERTSHIPMILLSARAGTENRIEGLETGADDFITKPFDSDELLVRTRNLILQRKKLQERFMRNLRNLGFDRLVSAETGDLTSMDQQFLKKLMEKVTANLSDPGLTVEKLSSDMALSRRQLSRKIVAVTGSTPNRFIRSIRLARAAEKISAGTGTIAEIAMEVGFDNPSWFAKAFREQFGVLPSGYPEKKSG